MVARSVPAWLLALVLASVAVPTLAYGQDRGHKVRHARRGQASKAVHGSAEAKPSGASVDSAATGAAATAAAEGKAPAPAPAATKTAASADAMEDVRKEGGSDVKVLEFTGLDIDGQLKTPQMLYFLNRLRAEFGRPRLPHRSFLPELQRSTKDKAF
jgi:hypothetical protein